MSVKERVNGEFWTLSPEGKQVLRDLKAESADFNHDRYYRGEFDAFNYVWYENYDNSEFEANGCDYERRGCFVREGDVVLDVGGNIGAFSRRAEIEGASRVITLEPVTPTYDCLVQNVGAKTETYKFGLAGTTSFPEFQIHDDFTHIGGGTSKTKYDENIIVHRERALCLNVNEFFGSGLFDKIDFMKVDIEGGEYELFDSILDEHLSKMRCVAAELHDIHGNLGEWQEKLNARMSNLGFTSFTLFYGDFLRTVNYWKI
jgi:FkbM family methyltransferase